MYTRKNAALRATIPFLVVAGMFGFVVVAAPRYPNLAGAAMVAFLVGLVAWWIYAARHPDRWPLPKKALCALRAAGFEGYKSHVAGDPGLGPDNVDFGDDGFSIIYRNDLRVDASMNEKTRTLGFSYSGKEGSWPCHEDKFSVRIHPRERFDDDASRFVVAGEPSRLHVSTRRPAAERFVAWIGDALGEQLLALPVSSVSLHTNEGRPLLSLDMTLEEGTFAQLCQVIAAAKELFWKLKDAAEAEHEPVANAGTPFRGRSGA